MLWLPFVLLGAAAVPDASARPERNRDVRPLERVDRERALKPYQGPDELVDVPPELGLPGRRLDPLALAYFADLSDEVYRRFGRRLVVASGYRSHSHQRRLFRRYVKDGVRRGLSKRRARRKANTFSALPGHSEHQLGTTIDIKDVAQNHMLQGPDKDPRLQRWLRNNAHRYGFINSYPPGHKDPHNKPYRSSTYKKTGYIVEPWHWRFVGKRAAALHHKLERRAGRRITTHEFVEKLSKRDALRRRLERPHASDRAALKRLDRRLRKSRAVAIRRRNDS